jgi:hypothetical protein
MMSLTLREGEGNMSSRLSPDHLVPCTPPLGTHYPSTRSLFCSIFAEWAEYDLFRARRRARTVWPTIAKPRRVRAVVVTKPLGKELATSIEKGRWE